MASKQLLKHNYTTSEVHEIFDEPYQQLKKSISKYIKKPNYAVLDRAYNFAIEKHIKQVRRSGDPYFDHLYNVAAILSELKLDITTISAGFLHDVLEDTDVSEHEFESIFGETITNLVNGVTKITSLSAKSQKVKQSENFRKMILSSADDIRVILIKFADRLHNMRTLKHMPAEKRSRIATETIEVFAPLAHRFGLQRVKVEYEDLAFKYLDSDAFYFLKRKIEESAEQRSHYIEETIAPIKAEMKRAKIKTDIFGRPKHFYSIYNKMQKRNKPFEEIYDLLAIRILVEKVEHCYFTLGTVHSLYIPVVDRFKDYIATPKRNGYQSLHTTVVGPQGQMVEIQIRTHEMDIHAEEGIAAHWRYKYAAGKQDKTIDDPLLEHVKWLKQFLEQQNEDESEEFLENLKIDLFQDEVFVYSPKGDLYTLASGASALDFAFHIHSNLGIQCSGTKINGQIKPIKTVLKNGDVVQIISSKKQNPNREWLDFVKTGKARHHIKKWLKHAENEQNLAIGSDLFNDIIKRFQLKRDEINYDSLLKSYNKPTIETFLIGLGRNEISLEGLSRKLKPKLDQEKLSSFVRSVESDYESTANFFGIKNLLTSFAKCCSPIPGDEIIGYITAGRGLTLHRESCKNLKQIRKNNEQRLIKLNWSFFEKERDYNIQLNIIASDRNFLVKDLSNTLSKVDVNLRAIDIDTDEQDNAFGTITITVKSLDQLKQVVRLIKRIPAIKSIERNDDSTN